MGVRGVGGFMKEEFYLMLLLIDLLDKFVLGLSGLRICYNGFVILMITRNIYIVMVYNIH